MVLQYVCPRSFSIDTGQGQGHATSCLRAPTAETPTTALTPGRFLGAWRLDAVALTCGR
jgi:hypothetical protein